MTDNAVLLPEQTVQPVLLSHCLQHWAQLYGSRIALVNEQEQTLSYRQLYQRVEEIAAGLYARGLRAGDHAMVQMPNTLGFYTVFFALLRLGAIPVMAMPNQREQDINALIELATPVAFFIPDGPEYLALANRMQQKHPTLRLLVSDGPGSASIASLTEMWGATCPQPEPEPGDTALLLLSGGTTGTPKLIPRTHDDYFYNFTASARLCGFNSRMVFLAVLPAAHNFTLASPGVLGTWQCGGKVVTTTSASCDETMPLIEKQHVTHVALVPPLAKLWVEGREWEDSSLASLQVIQVGGARLEAGLARQLVEVMGCQLQQVFGMAEGLLCYTRLDDSLDTIIQTQGRPLSPEDEIRIVDEQDNDVAEGETGQLLTRGPYTIRGYFRAPAHNASSFTMDGYYCSGDLVRRDALGNLIVEGRIKEQINRAGEKISAAEVEEAISALHGVHAAVAVGVPDPLMGERICVFIKTTGRAINPAYIKTELRERGISDYKIPDQIEAIAEWPLTAARKIDKRQLVTLAIKRIATTSDMRHYQQESVAISDTPLDLAVKLFGYLRQQNSSVALYERHGELALGVGSVMEITVEADGSVRRSDGECWQAASPAAALDKALATVPFIGWRAYGHADFELSYLACGVAHHPHPGRLMTLTLPRYEIRLRPSVAELRALNDDDMAWIRQQLSDVGRLPLPHGITPVSVDVRATGRQSYEQQVASAVQDMQEGRYQKVILSRTVEVTTPVDMVGSYYAGRQRNTPARSFLLQQGNFQAYGFSPEIVVAVDANRQVTTQPLAGTRALTGDAATNAQLRQQLLSDSKEIAEHAVSVKLATEEMEQVCRPGSVTVNAFMSVLERGSVQHLASEVSGILADDASPWTAFEKLFPAVTASGIPKAAALESIRRHERERRGLYSGCVLITDSDGQLDAALVLRATYCDGERCWLRAGAGLVAQSMPEREWEETSEKLSSVAPWLFALNSEERM
ncbi:salicylate synthase [Erwinia psidii]|nr:salicylate synthase [Erwinia psidii]